MNKDPPAIMGSSIPVNSSSIGRRRHSRSSVHNEVFSPKEAMHIRQVDNTQRYVVKTPSASFHGRDDFDVKPSSGGSSGRNNGHRTSKSFHGSVDGPTPPPLPPRRTSRSFHGHHQPQQHQHQHQHQHQSQKQQHNRHCHVHPDIPLNTATEAQCPKCTVELMKIAARELERRANELERGTTTEASQTTTKQHRHVKKEDATTAAAAANHSNGNGSKHSSTAANNNFNSTTPIEEDVERLTQINALLRWSSAFQHVTKEELRRKTKEELHQMAKEEFRKKSEAHTNNSSGSKRNSRSNSRPIHRPSLTSEDRPQLGSLMKPKSSSSPSQQQHHQQQQQRKSRQDQNNQNHNQKQHRPHQQQQQQQLTPKYSIGQKARHPSHVQPTSTSREETLITIAQLKEGEGAFIRRSNNEWTYATLTSRERFGADACLVFTVNARGATKSFPLTSWAKFVRLVAKTTNSKIENKKVEGETEEEEDDSELDLDLDLGGEKEEIDVMIHPTEEKGEVEEESVEVDEESVEVEEESVDLFSTGSPNTESDYDEDDSFHAMELPGQKYNDVAEEKEIPSKDIIFDHNVSMYTLNPDLGNSVPSILHSTNHRKKCAPTNHIAFHRSSSNTSESTARSSSPLSSYFGDDDKEDNSRKNLNSSSERMFRRSLQDETKGENLNLSFEQLFRKSLQGTSDTAAFSSSDKMEDKNSSDDTDQEESAPRSRRKGRPIQNHRVSWHDEIEEFHEQPKEENEDSLPTKQASASMGDNVSQYQKRHSMPNVSSSSEESQIAMNNTATTNHTKKKLRELNMGNQNHSFMHALKSMHRRSSMVVPPSSSRAAINFN